jgi:iron complex outermembrane receptor protein
MQRRAATTLVLLSTLLLLAIPLSAQTGTIAGRVTDAETGQPIGSVRVQLLSGTSQAGNALSNQAGEYRFSIAAGTYAVVAQFIGYADERIDGVSVAAGQTRTVDIPLRSVALQLNPITVVATGREEKALDAPANVTVVGRERIENEIAVTAVDHVKALPGVDITQTGISQSNVVTRGFNNIFSGALLVITDNRYASVPSLRFNAYNMIPLTSFDPQRMEVLLGPASALYGPNAANGVLHIITSSPLDDPGTSISVAGGERSLLQGQFRHASRLSDQLGFKVSGQYFRANDWEFTDLEEVRQKGLNPSNTLIGARDFDSERWGGEARVDFRPADNTEVIVSGGLNQLVNSIELTGVGAGQARDWRYSYAQARFRSGRLFAQAFLNQSNAGDTYLLRTGQSIVDESRLWAAQVQHGLQVGERLDLIYGVDLQHTEPRTEGTITGRNEDDDVITEVGGYVHGTLGISPNLDLIAALRADKHNRLEDVVYSPRAALVYRPLEDQTFRVTFNRAFSTPTTNNLFLDLVAARIGIPPSAPVFGYDVRLLGVPKEGLTFTNRCTGGVQQLCMYSPLAAGQLPANALPFWDALVAAGVPAQIRPLLLQPGRPGDPALGSLLRRLDFEAAQSGVGELFPVDAVGPISIERLRPTITNTFEAGYKGIVAERLLVALDAWTSRIEDFVGPLHVETPSVFFNPQTVQAFVLYRLQQALAAGLVTQAQATAIIQGLSAIPVGTVAPDQNPSSNLLVTYRNYGELELWGADVAFQFLATDQLSFLGGFSWVDQSCFDFNDDGRCSSTVDIALNAPKVKGSLGARWSDAVLGLTLDGRVRHNGDFPMNSGVYVGEVDGYNLVDVNASYQVPWVPGVTASLTVNNVLDEKHREAVGAPELGRLAMVQLIYRIR